MVDELLPYTAQVTLELFIASLGSIVMIAVLVPWVMLCVPPLLLFSALLQRRYTRISRELKRLDGLSRSPLYAHFTQHLQVGPPARQHPRPPSPRRPTKPSSEASSLRAGLRGPL